ncbi:MAG: (cytosine-5)-methyltransferase 1 [Verrucomicrobiota bacterium]|jgi:DNA (cytosine-5)-methyltransferase 1
MSIPVIDLFAGPGGLSEGFSAFALPNGVKPFKVGLSIEKDSIAHQTLELRSFYRQFGNQPPRQYFQYLRREITRSELFAGFPQQAKQARKEAWCATLGEVSTAEVDRRITESLGPATEWVLIGGPPCQAYSMAGRSRNGGIDPKDDNVFLYKEYFRILAVHKPPVFVMENVKGLLSARTKKSRIFHQMLRDLENPISALAGDTSNDRTLEYQIFSLVEPAVQFEANGRPVFADSDFVIKSEKYGIPQARHRVILLGIKNQRHETPALRVLRKRKIVSTNEIIAGLPRLRSGLSKKGDTEEKWLGALKQMPMRKWFSSVDPSIRESIEKYLERLRPPRLDRGSEFLSCSPRVGFYARWFLDKRIGGVCNHSTRGHLKKDLFRYLFCAAYGKVRLKTPLLAEFPHELLPEHDNVMTAMDGANFPDRFRVQIGWRCATTITSHISKDGHYYIHPDPTQCRSLTVREAARLQTFPDNYFFEGPRTFQYEQVGNAVPPLLARQIARVVWQVLREPPKIRNGSPAKPPRPSGHLEKASLNGRR